MGTGRGRRGDGRPRRMARSGSRPSMTNRAPGRSPGAGRAARGLPIEEYALIGDGHTAALVGRNGSIDWLCLPRFDSGACFAALLGNEEHGFWRIAPASDAYRVTRCYRGETLVLETATSGTPAGILPASFGRSRRSRWKS